MKSVKEIQRDIELKLLKLKGEIISECRFENRKAKDDILK
jgi:hypothetical protein